MKLEITSVSGFLYASPSYRVRPNSRHHIQALIKPNYRTRGLIAGRGHFARAEILGGVKRRLYPEPSPRADLITEPVHGVLLHSLEYTLTRTSGSNNSLCLTPTTRNSTDN